mgnify:FL=1
MMNCAFCQKKLTIKFILSIYGISATEIANAVHLSKSMVWKHLNGDSYNENIDIYIVQKVFGLNFEGHNHDRK